MSTALHHVPAPHPHRPSVATTGARVVPVGGVATSRGATRWSSTAHDHQARFRRDTPAQSATGRAHECDDADHERGVTVVFTDIEDSSALVERLGDRRWLELFSRHTALVHSHVARHHGVVVKAQGDGFMAAFPDPVAAVECAVAIQRELAAPAAVGEERLRVRIGVHTGKAIRQAGDFHGRTVVIAARIAAQAGGREILVSGAVACAARRTGAVAFAARGTVELKGLCGHHAIYAAEWTARPAASRC